MARYENARISSIEGDSLTLTSGRQHIQIKISEMEKFYDRAALSRTFQYKEKFDISVSSEGHLEYAHIKPAVLEMTRQESLRALSDLKEWKSIVSGCKNNNFTLEFKDIDSESRGLGSPHRPGILEKDDRRFYKLYVGARNAEKNRSRIDSVRSKPDWVVLESDQEWAEMIKQLQNNSYKLALFNPREDRDEHVSAVVACKYDEKPATINFDTSPFNMVVSENATLRHVGALGSVVGPIPNCRGIYYPVSTQRDVVSCRMHSMDYLDAIEELGPDFIQQLHQKAHAEAINEEVLQHPKLDIAFSPAANRVKALPRTSLPASLFKDVQTRSFLKNILKEQPKFNHEVMPGEGMTLPQYFNENEVKLLGERTVKSDDIINGEEWAFYDWKSENNTSNETRIKHIDRTINFLEEELYLNDKTRFTPHL